MGLFRMLRGQHADEEANMGLSMACDTCPSHEAPGPTKREEDHRSSLLGCCSECVDLPSPAAGGLGRGTSWPLGPAVC